MHLSSWLGTTKEIEDREYAGGADSVGSCCGMRGRRFNSTSQQHDGYYKPLDNKFLCPGSDCNWSIGNERHQPQRFSFSEHAVTEDSLYLLLKPQGGPTYLATGARANERNRSRIRSVLRSKSQYISHDMKKTAA